MSFSKISEFQQLSNDELYHVLGKHRGQGIAPRSPKKYVEDGKRFFNGLLNEITRRVCKEPRVRMYADKDPGSVDLVLLCSLLADLATETGVVALAILTSRYGIAKLCATQWTERKSGDE